MSKLNRDPARVIYISGHALDSCLQPENCLPIKPWKLEAEDTQLIDLIPLLECKLYGIECFSFQFLCSARCCHLWNLDKLTNPAVVATARVSDIRPVLASFEGRDIAAEFLERSR